MLEVETRAKARKGVSPGGTKIQVGEVAYDERQDMTEMIISTMGVSMPYGHSFRVYSLRSEAQLEATPLPTGH